MSDAAQRARERIAQFRSLSPGDKGFFVVGFLFVDDTWLENATEGVDFLRETDPEVIKYIQETWIRVGPVGTQYGPDPSRPHCVVAPYH